MTGIRATLRPVAAAAILFLACVAVMLALANARPPKSSQQPTAAQETLEEPREIQGVPCRGYASFEPDGRLAGCILSREHAFGSLLLPANTQIRRFHQDGMPKDVHLGKDTVLDGHRCRGEGPGEWMTGFYPSGRLAYCFLLERESIGGVPCEKATFWNEIKGRVIVEFHDNGGLRACELFSGVTIAGQVFKKGKRITLDPEGKVAAFVRESR